MTDEEIEAIRASDLLKLMKVVEHATGLWNSIERDNFWKSRGQWDEWDALGEALRDLGLAEVQVDGGS